MSDQIVDSCTLINLYGSTRPLDVLRSIGGMHVTPQVRKESLGIRTEDPENPGSLMPSTIDLNAAIKQTLLTTCELSANEFELMVVFARDLDDGEASSLAVAQVRNWTLATDDKKARRIARENGVAVLSTSELLHQWADKTKADRQEVSAVLNAVSRYARFSPPGGDPLFDWWQNHLAS